MNRILRAFLVLAFLATVAAAQSNPSSPAGNKSASSNPTASKSDQSSPPKDRAAAYYHYTLAHMYEEQVTVYGRSELANKAMEEYRLAIDADPSSEFLTAGLAVSPRNYQLY